MGNALSEFIDLLVGGVTELGSGIGSGTNSFVGDLFFKMSESGTVEGLSVFGGATAIFGGIGLAVGLTTLIFHWVRSIGN